MSSPPVLGLQAHAAMLSTVVSASDLNLDAYADTESSLHTD